MSTARDDASPGGSALPHAERPRRPVLVELAAAILVVGGAVSILSSIQVLVTLSGRGQAADALPGLKLAVGAALLVLGLLVRTGRAWLVAVNVIAVVAFLELVSGSIVGLVIGGLDVFVLLALLRERPWFQWPPEESRLAEDREDALSP